jgi:hypothetical protein
VGAVAAAVFAGLGTAANDGKVQICHGTASDTNPYVLISVDESAIAGHFDGTAPGHGKNNHPDFLAENGDCSTVPGEGGGE